VRLPRFRIAWLMVAVIIAALEFWAIRAVTDNRGPVSDSLVVGALPMASFLVVGLLIGLRHPWSRRFILGFEVFGAAALAVYIAVAICFTEELDKSYLEIAISPVRETIGRTGWTNSRLLTAYFILSIWASLPLLAFALLGGFLSRKFRIR
jgi:hypothetical protein